MRRDNVPLHDSVDPAVLYSIGTFMYLYSIIRRIVRGYARCTVWGSRRIHTRLSRCSTYLDTIVIYYE